MFNNNLKNKFDDITLIPLGLIIAVLPFIVYLKTLPAYGVLRNYWVSDRVMDFFSYYKMIMFLVSVFLGLILFIFYIRKNPQFELRKTKYNICLSIYAIFAVLSSLLAEHLEVALIGFPERFEGMLVILGYIFTTFLAYNVIRKKKQIIILLRLLLISAGLLGILGILQYFGMDPFQTETVQQLMIPASQQDLVGELNIRYELHRIYSTMYNPNYVGSYFAMLFPLTLSLTIFLKQFKYKILVGLVNILMFANLLGSHSRAGIVGTLASLLILILISRKQLIRTWKTIIILLICFIITFSVMNYASDGRLGERINPIAGEMKYLGEPEDVRPETKKDEAEIKDLIVEENQLSLITSKHTLNLELLEDKELKLYDEKGQEIEYDHDAESGEIDIKREELAYYELNLDKRAGFLSMKFEDIRITFRLADDGFWVLGPGNQLHRPIDVETWIFGGREGLASGRGYIWSRSLPMLKNTIFLGHGADSYAIYFPHGDIVGKLQYFGETRRLVDKPHNMYLQIAINTGLPSLLAVLALFLGYFWQSSKILWRKEFSNFNTKISLAIFTAFCGYAVAGIFNDSVVSVAPVFWCLLGLGISTNMQLADNESKE